MHNAHLEVVKEILEEMAIAEDDGDKKVKKYKGGRFERIVVPEEDNKLEPKKEKEVDLTPQWIDHGPIPKDVTTLIFNIFLHKINVGLSLESRTLMSVSGDNIYIVVRADEGDLKKTAETSKYTMQLAIGLTDLTSLEP